jgi:hypothetical protein
MNARGPALTVALLLVSVLRATLGAQADWSKAVDGEGHRSRATVRAFLKARGYPKGRPGHVVDHVVPLCAGGADVLANLQFQERQASYGKDVFERALCRALKAQGYVLVKKAAHP